MGAKKPPGSVDYGMKWLQSLNEIVIDNIRCPYAAEEFLKSNGDPEMLQNFANSWLAEPWEDTKLKTSADLIMERQSRYEEFVVPDWAIELTGGVDVQEDCAYWVIRAWGERWTSQCIARGQAFDLWGVDEMMNLNYEKRDGTKMSPSLVLVTTIRFFRYAAKFEAAYRYETL